MARFGLQIPNFTFDVPATDLFDQVIARAIAAEESGFDSVWVMDHFYQLPALGGPDQPMLEAYTVLGAIAARTERVHLGALVTGVTYRNPALLAKEVTTLDVISKGRAICGLGAAWYDVEHTAFGVMFPGVSERMDRLEEAAQICRAMFTQPEASFEGRYYRIDKAKNVPRPIRPEGIPIMIGGGGLKRTLRAVARYGDMCNISGDIPVLERKLAALRGHCEDIGRDPAEITNSRLSTLIITESDEQTTSTKEMLIGAAGADVAAGFTVGTQSEVLDQIAAAIEVGIDYFTFNMPLSDVNAIRETGELLSKSF